MAYNWKFHSCLVYLRQVEQLYFRLLFIPIERGVHRISAESLANLGGVLSKPVTFLVSILSNFNRISRYKKKQPSRDILRKRCSENMQQIYRTTPMLKCDFNKFAFRKKCSENMQQIYRRTPRLKCDFNKVAKQLY